MGFLVQRGGYTVAAGAFLPSHGLMLTPSLAGALMGFSSLGVMADSATAPGGRMVRGSRPEKKRSVLWKEARKRGSPWPVEDVEAPCASDQQSSIRL